LPFTGIDPSGHGFGGGRGGGHLPFLSGCAALGHGPGGGDGGHLPLLSGCPPLGHVGGGGFGVGAGVGVGVGAGVGVGVGAGVGVGGGVLGGVEGGLLLSNVEGCGAEPSELDFSELDFELSELPELELGLSLWRAYAVVAAETVGITIVATTAANRILLNLRFISLIIHILSPVCKQFEKIVHFLLSSFLSILDNTICLESSW
jgi:hypothetical protein